MQNFYTLKYLIIKNKLILFENKSEGYMASYKQLSKYNWQVVVSLGYSSEGKKQRIKKQVLKIKKKQRFL